VDSIQFARTSGELSWSAQVSDFERLAQIALDDEADFQLRLEGFQDGDEKPCLRLQVKGAIRLSCQRCLEPLSLEVASEREFVLVEREHDMMDLAEEDEAIESLVAEAQLDVLALAEDEILLQMPIAPMHDPGICNPPDWTGRGRNDSSAFSVLGTLTDTKD